MTTQLVGWAKAARMCGRVHGARSAVPTCSTSRVRVGTAEQMLPQCADILAAFAHPTNEFCKAIAKAGDPDITRMSMEHWIARVRGQ